MGSEETAYTPHPLLYSPKLPVKGLPGFPLRACLFYRQLSYAFAAVSGPFWKVGRGVDALPDREREAEAASTTGLPAGWTLYLPSPRLF